MAKRPEGLQQEEDCQLCVKKERKKERRKITIFRTASPVNFPWRVCCM
jgi:hypothetical protein